jgi:hypothetical protein
MKETRDIIDVLSLQVAENKGNRGESLSARSISSSSNSVTTLEELMR